MSLYAKPLPHLDGPNRPFWTGARAGILMLQHCLDCAVWRFPAARYCPRCRGERVEWAAVSGGGTITSFCVFHKVYFAGFAEEAPYAVIQVLLDEGVQLFSNLVDVPNDRIQIGARVTAHFEKVTPEISLVKFKPLERVREKSQ